MRRLPSYGLYNTSHELRPLAENCAYSILIGMTNPAEFPHSRTPGERAVRDLQLEGKDAELAVSFINQIHDFVGLINDQEYAQDLKAFKAAYPLLSHDEQAIMRIAAASVRKAWDTPHLANIGSLNSVRLARSMELEQWLTKHAS